MRALSAEANDGPVKDMNAKMRNVGRVLHTTADKSKKTALAATTVGMSLPPLYRIVSELNIEGLEKAAVGASIFEAKAGLKPAFFCAKETAIADFSRTSRKAFKDSEQDLKKGHVYATDR